MKKQKALELLNAQKNKLRIPGFTPDPWIDETSNYVAEVFGRESDQYRQTNEFEFKEDYPKTGWKYRVEKPRNLTPFNRRGGQITPA